MAACLIVTITGCVEGGVTFSVDDLTNHAKKNVTIAQVTLPLDEQEALLVANSTCRIDENYRYDISKINFVYAVNESRENWMVTIYSNKSGTFCNYDEEGNPYCTGVPPSKSIMIDEEEKTVVCSGSL